MRAEPDVAELYRTMRRIRQVERAVADLWQAGLISGEMHLSEGEEAVAAGVLAHLRDGDAIAVDHRSTGPFVARGVGIEAIVRELLGDEHGLNGGRAGHMHLMSPEHLAAASGIVGSSGPVACGFGWSAQLGGTGRVAVAFFGDGAVNEGMLLESFNLAAAWRLPVVFVCKDNRWSINTRTRAVTGGSLRGRARGFGLPVRAVDGRDVVAVWRAADWAVRRARSGRGPAFLLARVSRGEGHFLGDLLLRIATRPAELNRLTRPLLAELRSEPGAPIGARLRALADLTRTIGTAALDRVQRDPLASARRRLPLAAAPHIDHEVQQEVVAAVAAARTPGVSARA